PLLLEELRTGRGVDVETLGGAGIDADALDRASMELRAALDVSKSGTDRAPQICHRIHPIRDTALLVAWRDADALVRLREEAKEHDGVKEFVVRTQDVARTQDHSGFVSFGPAARLAKPRRRTGVDLAEGVVDEASEAVRALVDPDLSGSGRGAADPARCFRELLV